MHCEGAVAGRPRRLFLLSGSMTGAITALGDTVYPVQGSGTLEHLKNDRLPRPHLLVRLRVLLPCSPSWGVGGLWLAASRAREATNAEGYRELVQPCTGGALALFGRVSNIWLARPAHQVAHLFVACLLWLGVVIQTAMLWDLLARMDSSSDERGESCNGEIVKSVPETAAADLPALLGAAKRAQRAGRSTRERAQGHHGQVSASSQ